MVRADLLSRLGKAVRARRDALSMTRRALAEKAGVSERFLAQVEGGEGNISVARLAMVADALETTGAALLASAEEHESTTGVGVVSLLGLRGAGKSAVGERLAKRLGIPLVELDARIEAAAGMKLATLFELHGTASYRRLEREALRKVLAEFPTAVIATGGSVVTDEETFSLLKSRTTTVWLRARAEDHWSRVVAQGDARPMRDRANAMGELDAILRARAPLYAQARVVVDTSTLGLRGSVDAVVRALRTA